MRKIIGIAAPARSGKDTVAELLLQHSNVAAYALAEPLKMGCEVLFGLTESETWSDSIKENVISLWGRSPREFFQHVGTEWMRERNSDHWLMRAERAINADIKQDNDLFTPQLQDRKAPFKMAAQAFFGLSNAQTWNSDYSYRIDEFWGICPKQMSELIELLATRDFPDYFERRAQRPIVEPTKNMAFLGESEVIIIKDIRFENEANFLRRHNGVIWHVVRNDAQKVKAHASELGIQVGVKDVVIYNNGTLEQLALSVETEWRKFTVMT